jgi:hypothetical protein
MAIGVYGQDYFPLIEDNKNWSVLNEIFSFPWEPTTYYTENFKIDGDTIVNSVNYKKLFNSNDESPDYEETWIEGLGSDKGIIWCGTANIVGGWTYLLCVHKNNELTYMNPEYNFCYFVNTDISEETKVAVQIYPNPAKNTISIFIPEKIKFESVSLFNLSGQIVIELDPKNTCFDISAVKPGIYLLKILNESEPIIKKIIIE